MEFIDRDWDRSEKDDITLNVLPKLDKYTEAYPLYNDEGILIRWRIQSLYE